MIVMMSQRDGEKKTDEQTNKRTNIFIYFLFFEIARGEPATKELTDDKERRSSSSSSSSSNASNMNGERASERERERFCVHDDGSF